MANGTRAQLRYRFDNLMARGAGAQILVLGAATAVLITATAIALQLYGGIPDEEGSHESFGRLLWVALMHALEDWAWSEGMAHLRLAPSPLSATFYDRLGYVPGAVVELDPPR